MTNEELLFEAISISDAYEVDRLIKIGTNVNAKCKGMSAMHFLGYSEDAMNIAENLIIAGLDITNSSLLQSATIFGNVELMELLIKSGEDVNQADSCGKTPFLWLCSDGNIGKKKFNDVVNVLLKHGADINKKDNNERGAIEISYSHSNLEFIEVLCDYNVDKTIGGEPLLFEITKQSLDYFKRLVDLGVDINQVSQYQHTKGETVLFRAIVLMKTNLAKFLIKNGADLNCQNVNGETPAIYAAKIRGENHILALLKAGADFSIEDNKGKTALDYLTYDDNFKSLVEKKLLERDCDNHESISLGL